MKWQGTWIGPGVLVGVLALGGCGRPFETGGGGAGGTGSTGGSGSTGGAGSGTTTTGTTTTACTPGLLDTCGVKQYCDASLECKSCLLAPGFKFGPGQPITLGQGPVSGTFPRMDASSKLFYVDTNGQIQQAGESAKQGTWGTPSALSAPYNPGAPTKQEGPLPWSDGTSVRGIDDASKVDAGSPILLFGSQPMGGSQLLYVANLVTPVPPSADALKMPPFVSGDRSIAVSFLAGTPRAFWVRGGHLWTAPSGFGSVVPALKVTVPFAGGCAVDPDGAINGPWIGPDGARLLFSAPSYSGASCTIATTGSQARLFYIGFDAGTGLPTDTAAQIFPGDTMDDDETPSVSPDQCLLLFTRDGSLTTALRE